MNEILSYPSLSEDGWVNDPIKVADYILSDFFLSEKSQTDTYLNSISSLPFLIQSTQGNVNELISKTKQTLTNYFDRYFQNTIVEVSEVNYDENLNKTAIRIFIQFTDNKNKIYNIGKILELGNLKINRIIEISNG